jgi:hypothetical protein
MQKQPLIKTPTKQEIEKKISELSIFPYEKTMLRKFAKWIIKKRLLT